MQLQQRINAFAQLGTFLNQFRENIPVKDESLSLNDIFYEKMEACITTAHMQNSWFTPDNLAFTFKAWGGILTKQNLEKWYSIYNIEDIKPKTVATIMAGNIPLVGFHDFLSVLLTGHYIKAKLSSNDKVLLPFLAEILKEIHPSFIDRIQFTEEKLENFDAVIATGSNNTATHFEYYFGKYPNIIRKNRNSVAILTGEETKIELELLANDIFRYFGLGCRNISKIFIPQDYNFDPFFNAMYTWKGIINNHKYINNYDYNKAIYLMSNIKLLDNEFMLLKEDSGYSSPISVVFYEYYDNKEALEKKLVSEKENIQAVVSKIGFKNEIPFGKAQTPSLWEYADGVDTLEFLSQL
ncbi:acyl-CoA reductase [Patiriisocius hiemis]|uniref:Acyl-CoA reductase n=1 Tax=Patiriisocius hiemis TaxID=3075604 RepID=A0ABU2YBA1_9FLAO|nr:acyl-CoA reductase [Constantimarinum sp. W242]MDT0554909.1 acyl-CoA reductase [Constantimarinum sp. W242]